VRGLLAFLDPLLGRAALVVEPDDRATGERHVRHDEPDARKQFARIMLDLGDDSAGLRPAVRACDSDGPVGEKDVFDLQFQSFVCREADGILHVVVVEPLIVAGNCPRR
jgi:hypothetical protein